MRPSGAQPLAKECLGAAHEDLPMQLIADAQQLPASFADFKRNSKRYKT
jgi:hypothetical protein